MKFCGGELFQRCRSLPFFLLLGMMLAACAPEGETGRNAARPQDAGVPSAREAESAMPEEADGITDEEADGTMTGAGGTADRLSGEENPAGTARLRKAYADILLRPEAYEEYYAVTEHIAGEDIRGGISSYDGSKPYCFAVSDVDGDGTDELLLGYGMENGVPEVLLNILRYEEKENSVVDVDGERTYPLMDSLWFCSGGYFGTQNGVSDLYTVYWCLKEKNPEHYWYGWERGERTGFAEFGTPDAPVTEPEEFYRMTGDAGAPVKWREATRENVEKELDLNFSFPVPIAYTKSYRMACRIMRSFSYGFLTHRIFLKKNLTSSELQGLCYYL